MIEEATRILSCFIAWITDYRSDRYDPQCTSQHLEEALNIIKSLQIEHFFTIHVGDDNSMLINGVSVSLDEPGAKKFFVKLRQKGVITIVISKGVRAGELQRFLADLASLGRFFHSYAHIAVQRSEQLPSSDVFTPRLSLKDKLKIIQIKRIFRDISEKGHIDITILDTVVGSLIAAARKEWELLFENEENGDDLYIHSAKVAVLSILQGDHLGLGNALLYDIGVAALLHDVGKTLLPNELLDNQDPLSETEWKAMKNHPIYGAALLASLNKIPEIAIIAAYEHHKKNDGTGYPVTKKIPRNQHIISQIVAVADFYCTMRNSLPYRKPLNNNAILGLLAETAGKEFNPLLVDNFVQATRENAPHAS